MDADEAHQFQCPLTLEPCCGNECMWWLVHEEDDESKDGCAISIIAKK